MSTPYANVANTISELKQLSSNIRENKLTIYVLELNSWVTYHSSSNKSEDNQIVFAPFDNIGRWIITNQINKSNIITQKISSYALSALRIVELLNDKLIYSDYLTSKYPLGITKNAYNLNELCDVITFGEISDNSWNWDITKSIYLGSNGYLTQTPPSTGNLIHLGSVLNTKTLNINIESYIEI